MAEAVVLSGMSLCALIPFFAMAILMHKGKSGLALTIISVIGAALVILYFGIKTPIGLDPVQVISLALLFALPAFLGASAGGLVGIWMRRRDERK